jgi:hypothetical protein
MGTRPAWKERLSSVEREVRAWVGGVEQLRGPLGPIVGDEDHRRAGCRATKLFECSEIRGGNNRILTLKRTLTDFKGVGGLGRFLSSRHLRRCAIALFKLQLQ